MVLKYKTTDEEGNEVETDERVSIASVNEGVPYVYDEDAVKKSVGSGHRKFGTMLTFREFF